MKPLSPTARRLLELSRGQDEPDALSRDRVARSLAARIASGADVGAVGTSLPTTAAAGLGSAGAGIGSVIAKSVLVACLAGAAATTGYLGLRSSPRVPRPQHPAETAAVFVPAPLPEAKPAPVPLPAHPSPELSSNRKPARLAVRPEPKPPMPAMPPVADRLREETEALRSAQQALRDGQAQQALKLLEAQDGRFHDGVLQQERAAARVLALCQTGLVDQARRQAEEFERLWPRSALLARVRFACWKP